MDRDEFIEVLEYVENHITEKISLKELADLAGYSPYYFSKLFSDIYGIPVTGYIRIRKLQYSVQSLLDGMKVIDVALLYSFESHEGFTRSFAKLFGSSPSIVKRHLKEYKLPNVLDCVSAKRAVKEDDGMNLCDEMHQLVFEVLKNSMEEAKEGHCSKIEINILPNNVVRIFDDGRGIPLEVKGVICEEVLSNILAGAPITKLEYSKMGDLPLDSLKVVNSLCENLTIKVYRSGNCYQQDYVRGVAQHEILCSESNNKRGTEITMKPDVAIFGNISFEKETIQRWINEKNAGDIVVIVN